MDFYTRHLILNTVFISLACFFCYAWTAQHGNAAVAALRHALQFWHSAGHPESTRLTEAPKQSAVWWKTDGNRSVIRPDVVSSTGLEGRHLFRVF